MSRGSVYVGRLSWIVATGALLVLAVSWLSFVYPFTAIYIMRAFNVSITMVSLMVAVDSVTVSVGSIVVGVLMDRYGVRLVGSLSAIVTGVFTMLVGFSSSIYMAIILFGLACLFSIPPITPKVVSEWFPESMYARATTYVYLGFYVTLVIMGPLTAYIISLSHSWRAAWIDLGIICIALGVISFFLLRDRNTNVVRRELPRVSIRRAFRYRETWVILLIALFMLIPESMIFDYFTLTLEVALGLNTVLTGWVWSAIMMAGVMGSIILPIIADTLSNRRIMFRKNFTSVIAGLAGIFITAFALFLYVMPISILTVVISMGAFFGISMIVLVSALIPEYLPSEITATVGGITVAAQIPLAALPPLAGIIVSAFGKVGWIYIWIIAAAGAYISAVILAFILKSPAQRR